MKKMHLKKGTTIRPVPFSSNSPKMQEKFSVITREMISHVMEFDEQPRKHTVCFTGHRRLEENEALRIAALLDQLLPACYQKGYHTFLTGGAIGFDMLAAEAVARLRNKYRDVKLVLVIPCADQTFRWSESDCKRYEQILYSADETRVLAPSYYEGCMMNRNRHMVDHSGLCICYLKQMKGGTVSTVTYAIKHQVNVLNVAMEDACAAYIAQES